MTPLSPDRASRLWITVQGDLQMEGYDRNQALSIIALIGMVLLEIGMSPHYNTEDPLFIEALKRTASVLELLNEDAI